MSEIQVYLKILKDYPESYAETLIEELFRNNKHLIKQAEQVKTFTKRITKIISELKPSSTKRSKLLLSLYSFMKLNGKVVKNNQTVVLNMITLNQSETVMFLPENHKVRVRIIELLKDFNHELEKAIGGIGAQIILPPEIDYLNSLLRIMAYACEDKNAVTESKAQVSFTLDDIVFLYDRAEYCWQLKTSVLLFFYHVYLDTEKKMKEEKIQLKTLFEMMARDMAYIVENYKSNYDIQSHIGVQDSKAIIDEYYF